MKWTREQENAINLEGKNIIVSAGAGSGKTAVLTERVIRKLKSGVHINELLILTFTNAAANEMKERIRKAIKKDNSLKEELDLIDSAYITTFDSYALSIVKKYHTHLNITNNIKITDEVIINLKKKELLDLIFDKYYLNPTKEFNKLIRDFCLKDDLQLKNYILDCYKKIELKYDKDKYLDNYIDNYNIDGFVDEYINLIFNKISYIKNLIKELPNYFEEDFIKKIEDNFKDLINSKEYSDVVKSLDYETIKVPRGTDLVAKNIKQDIFDTAKELKELVIYNSVDEIKEEIESTMSNIGIIIDILKELNTSLELYKKENDIYSYNDIAYLSIKLIEDNSNVREEITNSYNEILLDEYQDTSDTQEKFISMISNNNLYMVGDIKQSIYRFRNANPYIFKNKYDLYSNSDSGIKIDLLDNFRSREEVLNNINLIFDYIMSDEIGGADYKKSHRMVYGNKLYDEYKSKDYNLDVLTYEESDSKKEEIEAFIIGNDIKNKINSKYQVFDKDKNVLRDIKYSDISILLDRSKNFELYNKVFKYLGIPITIWRDDSLSNDKDILVIKNLLKFIISIKENNIDTYSFVSIGRSFLCDYKDNEIYEYVVKDNIENSSLYKKCLELINNIDIMSPSSYLNYVLDCFDYDYKLITISNVLEHRVRREYLFNLVRELEDSGNTIYDFVEHLDNIFDNDLDLKFNTNMDNSNSCKIMTIHKAKGLEFPVCYYASLFTRFNLDETKKRVLYDNKYGIVIPKVDDYYKDTIIKTLVKNNIKKEEISEEIRLLYVALTRVKEKMIIVIPKIEEEKEVLGIIPNEVKEKYNCFLDVIKSIYSLLLPYVKEIEVDASREYLYGKNNDKLEKIADTLEVEELNIDKVLKEETHYSKDKLHLISREEKELMDFGSKVHEVLELIDFNNPDYSLFDINDEIKSKINKFLNSNLIKDNLNNKMYKEYEFIYKEGNTLSHGIIDLMIESDDKIIIIDYKLKNIEDNEYDKQLNGYREFIKNKLNKEVDCYLYSILDEDYREVN